LNSTSLIENGRNLGLGYLRVKVRPI
jgi:hypothetical protein